MGQSACSIRVKGLGDGRRRRRRLAIVLFVLSSQTLPLLLGIIRGTFVAVFVSPFIHYSRPCVKLFFGLGESTA